MISDETSIAQRERAERDERETTALMSRLLGDRLGFAAFTAEAPHHVDTIAQVQLGTAFQRSIHTLKGICAIEGVSSRSPASFRPRTSLHLNYRPTAPRPRADDRIATPVPESPDGRQNAPLEAL